MRDLGLRDRVTLASALVLLAGLALLTLGVSLLLSRQLDADASSALRERAAAQLATLDVRGRRIVVRDAPHDEALDQQAWVYQGVTAIQRPPAPAAVQRAADALARAPHGGERTVGERVRLRGEPVRAGARGRRAGTVVVGISLVPYDHTEHIALVGTLLLDLFVLAAGALLARRAVANALRPVADMTERAADWSEHDLDRRFNLGPPRDELTGLSATLDALLARIASSLRHEQRFSAEMAHELRTPLSGLRGEAELALRPGRSPAEMRDALEQVVRGTERMEAVIETLLAAARRDAGAGSGASDAARAARLATDAVRPLAEEAGVRMAVVPPPPGLRVGADEDLVAQALHPLLANAVRHARDAVAVTISQSDGEVHFCVQDDGDGVDAARAGAMFEPGTSTAGGAGLGLPLARRLARSCGGDVAALPSAEGARFVLRLPALS
jgi:signal transduction histidine kinase